jgi:hypothetical protein
VIFYKNKVKKQKHAKISFHLEKSQFTFSIDYSPEGDFSDYLPIF